MAEIIKPDLVLLMMLKSCIKHTILYVCEFFCVQCLSSFIQVRQNIYLLLNHA